MLKVKYLKLLIPILLLYILYGCGGPVGESESDSSSTTSASYLDLLASSSEMNSAGTSTVTLTALVKDSRNRALSGATVDFSADSGSLIVNSATTDASGQATATLGTGGDKSNRTITVTATSGSITSTNTIAVVGTTIDISGQDGLAYNSSAEYTFTLKDSAGNGIPNQTMTISSLYNTLDRSIITTNGSGQGTATLTATDSVGHEDTISASAFGATGIKTVNVDTVTFTFTAPTANSTININTPTNVTVNYTSGATPQAGVTILFTTSRGVLSADTAVTNASGNATIQIQSTNVGEAILTASVAAGPSTQLPVEFLATNPVTIELQANPSVIVTNIGSATTQRSTITAVLRDSANNPVKDKKVNFTLTSDPSVGFLSPDSATTNSFGSASVYYIAGSSSSGIDGVVIQASVEGTTLSKTVNLTVAGTALFISVGTGDKISKHNTETYRKDFTVIVTDAAGHAVPDAYVTARLTPIAYLKGIYTAAGQVLTLGSSHPNPPLSPYADPLLTMNHCGNEDITYWPDTSRTLNGWLDEYEDYNGNGSLDPGNIAAVSSSVTTDENGLGTVSIFYTKQYASWVYVRLDVTVSVGGTEGTAHQIYLLRFAADDYTSSLPPDSPYGSSTTCADDN